MASYRDLLNFFTGGQAGVRRKKAKKNFCINCDTADSEEIGKGKRCKACDSQLVVNPYFGSVFRTTSLRTMFFFELLRYADIYTSDVTNSYGKAE